VKTRSLALFDGALLLVIGLTGLVLLVTALGALADDRITGLTVGLAGDDVRGSLPGALTLQEARAEVDAEVDLPWRLLWWGVGAATGAVLIAGAEVLRAVVASARAGDPFVAANVRRLRIVGVLALVHAALSVARVGVDVALQDHLGTERVAEGGGTYQVALAIVVFAVAEIWQRGVELRDEQQLTV
jgi:hypothetical protein